MLNDVEPYMADQPDDGLTLRFFIEEAGLWRRSQVAASDVIEAAVQVTPTWLR